MVNDISITFRIPKDIDEQLKTTAQATGITKTNLLRQSIHDYLDVPEIRDFTLKKKETGEKTHRIVLNINSYTHQILEKQAKRYSHSVNNLLIYSAGKIVEYYSRLIEELRK